MTISQKKSGVMSEPILTRKQQERIARDELILSVASDLFAEKGYHHTTMQHIADKVGYSKGTIYQHYTCKEDVLAKLYLLCGYLLLESIQSVLSSHASTRMKIMMITSVFLANSRNLPAISANVTMVKSPDFFSKLSIEHQQEITKTDAEMLEKIIQLFNGCTHFDCTSVKRATFGWWSMLLGVQSILISGWDINSLGFQGPEQSMFHSLSVFLDGLNIPVCNECISWEAVEMQAEKFQIKHTF